MGTLGKTNGVYIQVLVSFGRTFHNFYSPTFRLKNSTHILIMSTAVIASLDQSFEIKVKFTVSVPETATDTCIFQHDLTVAVQNKLIQMSSRYRNASFKLCDQTMVAGLYRLEHDTDLRRTNNYILKVKVKSPFLKPVHGIYILNPRVIYPPSFTPTPF